MVIVFSPHMDDAVLSMGQHILNWKKQGKKVKIITVFTKFSKNNLPEYTQDYVTKSGFKNVTDFEKARIEEDKEAMKMLGVEYEHWGMIDAGFRGNYMTKKELMSGKIKDIGLVEDMAKKINDINVTEIYLPYGVGGHVDHLIVRKAGSAKQTNNIRYYLESPYLWQDFNYLKYVNKIFDIKSLMVSKKEKDDVLKCYKSQYGLLKKDGGFFGEIVI
jgi:LmbE family N-acetylglucosaminyl deacetylase